MNVSDDLLSEGDDIHASRMDRMYRLQRHIYDATRAYYLLGRDDMLRNLLPQPGGTVLEIGCGTGRNLVKAAQLYPHARFAGVDISGEMLKSAAIQVERFGLQKRVTLWQADATDLALHQVIGLMRFDRIFFSYTLSMIPEWSKAITSALTLLGEEGKLLIVDFGTGEALPRLFTSALHRWLRAFDVTPRHEMADVLASRAPQSHFNTMVSHSHHGYAVHAQITRRRHQTVIPMSQKVC